MLWLVLLALAAVMLAVVAVALLRMLLELVFRLIVALAASGALGLTAGIVADQFGYDSGITGVTIATLSLLPVLIMVWYLRGPIAERFESQAKNGNPITTDLAKPSLPVEREFDLDDAKPLTAAWDSAERLAQGEDLDQPRRSCAQFLAAHSANPIPDPSAIDMAVFIKRHVPGIVTDTQAVLDQVTESERAEIIAALIADLRELGDDAEASIKTLRSDARDRLKARHGRFAMLRARAKD